jgi:hypothetical protein
LLAEQCFLTAFDVLQEGSPTPTAAAAAAARAAAGGGAGSQYKAVPISEALLEDWVRGTLRPDKAGVIKSPSVFGSWLTQVTPRLLITQLTKNGVDAEDYSYKHSISIKHAYELAFGSVKADLPMGGVMTLLSLACRCR